MNEKMPRYLKDMLTAPEVRCPPAWNYPEPRCELCGQNISDEAPGEGFTVAGGRMIRLHEYCPQVLLGPPL